MGIDAASKERVAIVTGASRGLGKAIARCLLEAGWTVVGNGRDPSALKEMRDQLNGHAQLRTLAGDITNYPHLRSLVDTAEGLGCLRLVVNNAGALGPTPLPRLADLPTDALEALFRVNTIAPLRLIQLALPSISRHHGTIVNVSSDAAIESYSGWGAYGTTKSALEKLTSVFAIESPEVRFYALDPGDMRTDMQQAACPGEDISDRQDPVHVAPAVLRLLTGDFPPGRYKANEVLAM